MKSVILLSGGMDSTVLAHEMKDQRDLFALTFFSAANHENRQEVEWAKKTSRQLKLPHLVLDVSHLSPLFLDETTTFSVGGSIDPFACCWTSGRAFSLSVPTMHILACGYALEHGMSEVLWALHKDDILDQGKFRQYLKLLTQLVNLTGDLTISVPFLELTKKEVAERGYKLGVDFTQTSSCSNGNDCGFCNQCLARKDALELVVV